MTIPWQIFFQHFCGGRDTGDLSVLADCAAAAGMDRATAMAALERGDGIQWVRDEDARGRRELSISGVPHFALAKRGPDGAPVDGWLELSGSDSDFSRAFAALQQRAA